MTVLLATAFTATNGSAWAAPWTTDSGTNTIQTNRGQQATPGPGAFTTGEAKANMMRTNGRVDVTVRLTQVGNVSQRIRVRWDSSIGSGYELIIPTDYNGFQVERLTGFSSTPVVEDFTLTWSASTDYRVAFEFTGSTLRAKRWLVGSSEPTTWDISGADTTYTSGDVALATVSGATGGVVTGLWDNFSIDDGVVRDPARIGFHNDAFLAPFSDLGTYTTFSSMTVADTQTYLATQTAAGLPLGQESAQLNSPRTDWSNAAVELAQYHFTFLNPDYNPDVISGWGSNVNIAAANLGYRLRLVQAWLPNSAVTGQPMTVTVQIANNGYARPYRSRPAQLVMVSGGTTYTAVTTLDAKDCLPGATTTSHLNVTAPPISGTYALYLAFPDPSSTLASNPNYAIQLANTGIWDSTYGRNNLNYNLVVTGTSMTFVKSVILQQAVRRSYVY